MRTLLLLLLSCILASAQIPVERRLPWFSSKSIAWTPTSTPNLYVWFKPDVGKFKDFSHTAAGLNDPVMVWEDQSGNGHHVYTLCSTVFPTNVTGLNGYTAVFFKDGFNAAACTTTTVLTNNDLIPAGDKTVFAVCRRRAASAVNSWGNVFAADWPNTNAFPCFGYYDVGVTMRGTFKGGTSTGPTPNAVINNTWYPVTLVSAVGHNTMRTNTVEILTGTTSGTYFSNKGFLIGAGHSGATDGGSINGDLLELFMYTSDLFGTSDMTKAESYLKNKYGL